jgi:SAM-dependent methyltransferase
MAGQFGQEFWDERYRSSDRVWSGKPNVHLVDQAQGLTPGAALDVGSGEGADAIWLAQQGWQVTGVDISAVALERAAANAATLGADVAGRITWLHEDLMSWDPGHARFDLVSVQYMHLPEPERTDLFGRLGRAVAVGGTLLIVGHHPSDLQTSVPRPPMPERFYTADEIVAEVLDHGNDGEWDIVTSAAEPRPATDPEGRTVTVHDTVLAARRRRFWRAAQTDPD